MPIVGPAIVVPNDVNAIGLPKTRPFGTEVVMIDVCIALAVIASAAPGGFDDAENEIVMPGRSPCAAAVVIMLVDGAIGGSGTTLTGVMAAGERGAPATATAAPHAPDGYVRLKVKAVAVRPAAHA